VTLLALGLPAVAAPTASARPTGAVTAPSPTSLSSEPVTAVYELD
jgi:hypothetical protein